MRNRPTYKQLLVATAVASVASLGVSHAVLAASDNADLQKRIEAIEKQLEKTKGLEQELKDLKKSLAATEERAAAAEKQANADDNASIKFHISGATAADFTATDGSGKHDTFGGGKFLPIFLAQYKDWLLFEGHAEFAVNSDGETETSLEYAQLDAMATDWLTVVAGKFLSPIGQFQQAIHPPWINKLPFRPAGFVEDGGDEPLSEIGLMARGGVPVGDMSATYALYVGNGPKMGGDGPELEGFGADDNDNKAVGGRVSFLPWPYLEVGVSGMHARVKGMEAQAGSVSTADYNLIGADLAFTEGPWDVRGEVIRSRLDNIASALDSGDAAPTAIPATEWTNWYVQGAYRLSGVTDDPILRNFEPVVRYGQFHVDGFDDFMDNEEDRFSVGLDYWFAPSVVAKIAYENRDFLHKSTENVLGMQFAYGF